MNPIYRLFKLNPENREDIITATSGLGIFANILIAALKIIIGLMASSIAIVSEGMNNTTDALTSVLTLIGTKLAGKHPDAKHPFGYGRIEYLTSLIVSALILVTGSEMLISSIKLIFHPEELSISYLSLAIVAITAIIKFFLGVYTIRMGKKADSGALEAVGLECRGDSFISIVTILSALIFLIFHLNVDAFAGIFNSAIILKAGFEVLMDTVNNILGAPGEEELAANLYKEIRSTKGILNAADMMLHNYGPDAWSGSVNVEMDHKMTVGQVYQILHDLQLRIMHEQRVVMVFGIYAVDEDSTESRELRRNIAAFARKQEHVKSYHAVYLEPETRKIYCDLVVDYEQLAWDMLRAEFLAYMEGLYPGQEIELTIETEYV